MDNDQLNPFDLQERMERRRRRDSLWAGIFVGLFVGFFVTALILTLGYSSGAIPNEDLDAFRKMQKELKQQERDAFFDATVGPERDDIRSAPGEKEMEYYKHHGSLPPSHEIEEHRSRKAVLYAEWIRDWIVQGGQYDPSGAFSSLSIGDSVEIVGNGRTINIGPHEGQKDLIAPKGTTYVVRDLGYATLYYWDEEGRAKKEGEGRPIIYSDVLEELTEMDIPEVNKRLGR